MADEKKEAKKEEKKEEKKPAHAEAAAAPKAPKIQPAGEKTHHKKVGKMNLAEIEMAIERCQKQMGGLWSHYGQSLVGRKAALSAPEPVRQKKAA